MTWSRGTQSSLGAALHEFNSLRWIRTAAVAMWTIGQPAVTEHPHQTTTPSNGTFVQIDSLNPAIPVMTMGSPDVPLKDANRA